MKTYYNYRVYYHGEQSSIVPSPYGNSLQLLSEEEMPGSMSTINKHITVFSVLAKLAKQYLLHGENESNVPSFH